MLKGLQHIWPNFITAGPNCRSQPYQQISRPRAKALRQCLHRLPSDARRRAAPASVGNCCHTLHGVKIRRWETIRKRDEQKYATLLSDQSIATTTEARV